MLAGLGYFHSQLKATYEVLKNFRHFYPSTSLVVINDAGKSELEDISKIFQATYCPYSKNLTTGNNIDDINVMIEWMERFFHAIETIQESHVILLEDDVILLRFIDETKIQGQIFGYNPNTLLPEKVTQYLKTYNPMVQSQRIHYGGYGGCILEVRFFQWIASQDWKTEMRRYGELSQRFSPTQQSWYFNDCCLSFLCWRYGGEIVQNPEWGDLNIIGTTEKYKKGQLSIVHQYREHYNKPFSLSSPSIEVL